MKYFANKCRCLIARPRYWAVGGGCWSGFVLMLVRGTSVRMRAISCGWLLGGGCHEWLLEGRLQEILHCRMMFGCWVLVRYGLGGWVGVRMVRARDHLIRFVRIVHAQTLGANVITLMRRVGGGCSEVQSWLALSWTSKSP